MTHVAKMKYCQKCRLRNHGAVVETGRVEAIASTRNFWSVEKKINLVNFFLKKYKIWGYKNPNFRKIMG